MTRLSDPILTACQNPNIVAPSLLEARSYYRFCDYPAFWYNFEIPKIFCNEAVPMYRIIGLLVSPKKTWVKIRDENHRTARVLLGHTAILGLIPPAFAYFGTTKVGWTIGYTDPVRLTTESALPISIIYYLVILVSVFTLGKLIHWMNVTYGTERSLGTCVSLAAYPPTPLFLVGVFQIYPVLWLNYLVGLPALAYSIYLLYSGTEILMGLPRERAFLMASAILAVCLVALVGVLAATVTLWGFGLGPSFTH